MLATSKTLAATLFATLTAFAGTTQAGLLDGLMGARPDAGQATALARQAGFAEIDPTASNLREVLARSPSVQDVIPYGKNLTWVVPQQSGGGLLVSRASGEALAALAGICKTQWMVKAYQQDPMSNQLSQVLVPLAADDNPSLIYKHSEKNPATGQRDLLLGATCRDAFEITQVFLVGGVNQLVHSFLIKHQSDQATVWKSGSVKLPQADLELKDGVLDAGTITTAGYPLSSTVAAWAKSLCDLRDGNLALLVNAPDRDGQLPVTNDVARMASRDVPTKYTGNAPVFEFFLECSAPGSRSFLLKGQERDMKLQLLVQNNRPLASIFGGARTRAW